MTTTGETRQMLREFFPLLFAVAVQQILSLTVNLVDNFMLGSYSEAAMTGAAVVNQIQFMLQNLAAGIGAGVTVLSAQYWGKQEIDSIRRIVSLGLKFAFGAGVLFFVVCSIAPQAVLRIFSTDVVILQQAEQYLSLMRWSFVIFAISTVLMYSLQSVQTAGIGMVMSGCTICINATLNSIFIFGRFGAPELGIRGAAIATLTSRVAELLVVVLYILFVDKKLHMRLRHMVMLDATFLSDYVRVAVPMMMSYELWGISQAAQTAILGHASSEGIAANSVASVFYQLFCAAGWSCANAAAVITGKTVGRGREDLIRSHTRVLQLVFLGMGVVTGLALFVCRGVILSFYVLAPETLRITRSFMTILCVIIVGGCYEYPVECGIIAGGGNTKFAPIVDWTSVWLFAIPLAYYSAYVRGWPLELTFFLLKSDQLVKCIPNFIYCNSYRWIRNLTK